MVAAEAVAAAETVVAAETVAAAEAAAAAAVVVAAAIDAPDELSPAGWFRVMHGCVAGHGVCRLPVLAPECVRCNRF